MKYVSSKNRSAVCLAMVATVVVASGAAWVGAGDSPKDPLANLSTRQKQAIQSASDLSLAFQSVSDQLLPSVVAIENRPAKRVVKHVRPSSDLRGENPLEGTPFEDMFRGFKFDMPPGTQPWSGPRMRPMPSPRGGIGSGVIIDPSGIVLTNNHVVAGDGEVTIRTHDGRRFLAAEVFTDPKTDLAVVKIEGVTDLPAATLGDSDQVAIGQWVIALGQPFGLESSVTAGIISAKHRGIGITDRENFLQTDAAINPGNSGGPLVNLRGEVIGINTAIHSRSGGNDGIGFAIPSNLARWVGDQLINTGTVRRAYLGVGIQAVTADLAEKLAVKPRGGVVVTDVFPGTPAAEAGLRSGDVIVRFGDREVSTPGGLQLAVERSTIGDDITINVIRDGKPIELTIEAAEQPSDFTSRPASKPERSEQPVEMLGLEITSLDSDVAEQLGLRETVGVVITSVADGSPADDAGLSAGMVIVQVDRQDVTSVDEFQRAIGRRLKDSSDDGILLLVRSDQGSRFVVVRP